VAGRVRQGVPAFLVALAPALALTVVFARVFAAVFETPWRDLAAGPRMPDSRTLACGSARVSRSVRAWGGVVGSVLTLAVLIWRLGTSPFLDGLHSVNGGALAAAQAS
jgi:hypothetical protein